MLLMIDNYDSFTYNLVQYLGELGEDVRTVRNDAIALDEIEALAPARIVISPGPCTPDEAGVSLAVIGASPARSRILGVCLGHQAIGQAFRRRGHPRQAGHARQDSTSSSTAARACSPACRRRYQVDSLPFAGSRARQPARLPRGHGAGRDDGEIMGLQHKEFAARRGPVPPGVDRHRARPPPCLPIS